MSMSGGTGVMANNPIIVTLVFALRGDQVLLGLKKRGHGAGKWNGFGGKVNPEETIEAAAIREMHEECNLMVRSLEKMGTIRFEYQDTHAIFEGHIFRTYEWDGEPEETEEMLPQWYEIADIPYDQMWVNDPLWLPVFLEGKKFTAEFIFNEKQEMIVHAVIPQ